MAELLVSGRLWMGCEAPLWQSYLSRAGYGWAARRPCGRATCLGQAMDGLRGAPVAELLVSGRLWMGCEAPLWQSYLSRAGYGWAARRPCGRATCLGQAMDGLRGAPAAELLVLGAIYLKYITEI